MKEFSEALTDDRKFEIGGEVFAWHYPHWEEMAGIFDEDVELIRGLGRDGEDEEAKTQPNTKESIELTINRILVFLEDTDGAHDRFRGLAARKDRAVPYFLFSDLYRWLLEVTSARPTRPPSDSEPGGGSTEDTSPDESLSQEATQTS